MAFRALMLRQTDPTNPKAAPVAAIEQVEESLLPEGDTVVAVEFSTLNYKDGLALNGRGRIVRDYPHIPGVDLAGTVLETTDPRLKPGDRVVSTGWRVGEIRWGGYAEKARLPGEWLVKLPEAISTRQAMAVGSAGTSAMQSVLALEAHGLTPDKEGEVLVTGAAGGVGSVAVAVLANLGYRVAAVSGRPETEAYLRDLGAQTLIPRGELSEPNDKPLESERWAGCVDAVGGAMLGRILKQMRYDASVAAVGLAAGAEMTGASVTPFLLRGVNLLGIESVMRSRAEREVYWARLARDLPMEKLEAMIQPATLEDLPRLGAEILKGGVRGRVVVDLRA
ncbi:MDR family oxidoreductase [Neomegalonema perideroedes]|uniref:MDR family oxidoreductase n=1 Tax=Neomegalonema perideroedes TaxID=217219 RepID=UPI0003780AC4|nr:MDR family oxidoreductase [Neomegalonema perideroedes]